MTCRIRAAALFAFFLPAAAAAQTPADSTGPRGGSWGAEVTVGGGFGGQLLRFRSPNSAWLLGAGVSVTREHQDEVTGTFGVIPEQTRTQVQVSGRLGLRGYRDRGRRLRPFTGAGLTGALSRFDSQNRSWEAGAYGELGASFFFSPHVSLGAAGELSAGYGEDRRGGPPDVSVTATHWRIGAAVVRVLGAVYF